MEFTKSNLFQGVCGIFWVAALGVALSGSPLVGGALGVIAIIVFATTATHDRKIVHAETWLLTLVLMLAAYNGEVRQQDASERKAYYAYRATIGCGDYDGDGRVVRNKRSQPAHKPQCADPDSVLQKQFREALK